MDLTTLVALALAAVLGCGAHRGWRLLQLVIAYRAKVLASGIFVSQRLPAAVLGEDLAVDDLGPLRLIPVTVDVERGCVTAGLPGAGRRVARFTPDRGCVLLPPGSAPPVAALTARPVRPPESPPAPADPRFVQVLDEAFAEPHPRRPRRTRAVVIMLAGRIVAERYAAGFGPDTPLAGWSLAKAATNALVGILVEQGRLRLAERVAAPEWAAPDDPRQAITVDHLLRMESGLRFSENHARALQDVTFMLLREADAAAYAARQPLWTPPGTAWHYASGNTNILCRFIRGKLGEGDYAEFPRRALFAPLGMTSAVLESDAAGNFVGSSFMYATARDWARLGLLYANDGVHQGRRLLPAGWVDYSRTPTSDRRYGAHFWLLPDDFAPTLPQPADAFHGVGYEGQYLSIVPSRRLVVVRLGLTRVAGAWRQADFLGRVLAALETPP